MSIGNQGKQDPHVQPTNAGVGSEPFWFQRPKRTKREYGERWLSYRILMGIARYGETELDTGEMQ
ncbi:MAG: hypothetical protein RBR15_15955 [Sphaerochaeta sp.]|nr:hypothetical protein [Sphaerochaeta sp.]